VTSRAEMALSTGARIAFLLAVLLPAGMSRPAAETQPGRGGGLFLRVPLGARAVAMGESFVAPADDALSLFWNPAGLAPLRTPQIHTGHVSYFAETRIDSLAFNYPTLWGGLGLGTRWFTGSSIPRLRNGVPLGNFRNVESAMEMAMAVGKRNFSVGVLGRYYRHRIDDKSLDALMTDVGLLKSWRKGRYRIGFAAQNLGEDFGYGSSRDLKSPPPRQWRGGIAVRPSDNLLFAMDYLLPQHRQGEIHAGLELWLVRQVAFRSGYLWLPRSQAEALDPMAAWRFGMGLRVGPVELDYAYVPEQALGEMHHASLSYRFLGLTQLEEAGRVSMTVQPEFFSPNGDARRESAFFVIGTEGVEYVSKWAIEIRNSQSKRVRRFTGNGHPPGLTEWDGGLGRDTPAEEGEYLVQGRIWGRSSQALSKPVRVWLDRTPPSLRVEASTTVFSPDGDGLNDEVAFSLRAQDKHPLSHWKLEIPFSNVPLEEKTTSFESGIGRISSFQ
jgi:hypothetical protein